MRASVLYLVSYLVLILDSCCLQRTLAHQESLVDTRKFARTTEDDFYTTSELLDSLFHGAQESYLALATRLMCCWG